MNCTPPAPFNYYDTPEFLSLSLHFITVISTPVHILGLYFLLYKTPERMESVKWHLVRLHGFIVLFDYVLALFCIPMMLIPELALLPLGLLSMLGVQASVQMTLMVVSISFVIVSMVFVFENRFFVICMFSWKHSWEAWRQYWLYGHYVLLTIMLTPSIILVPEQNVARHLVFKNLPCLSSYLYEAPIFVATDSVISLIILIFFVSITVSEDVLFTLFLIFNVFQQQKTGKMSRKTFNLQLKFLIALEFQMLAPTFLMLLPFSYLVYAILFRLYNQMINNFCVILISMHGSVSTLVMLMVHQPYRSALLGYFRRKAVVRSMIVPVQKPSDISVIRNKNTLAVIND
ncbi:unnamed protein product [Caenorhabditis brenneri]